MPAAEGNVIREVSDALIRHRKAYDLREELSGMRYRGGVAGYLEMLTSQTSYLNAEQTFAREDRSLSPLADGRSARPTVRDR